MAKKTSGGPLMTRRQILKLGAAGGVVLGAPYLITGKKSALIPETYAAMDGGSSRVTSPPTTPFVQPMPIPGVKAPVSALSPTPDVSRFQHYSRFPAQEYFNVDVKEAGAMTA